MVQNLSSTAPLGEGRPVPARRKIPTFVARVAAEGCSGCEVCIAFCPVDCILLWPDPDGGTNPVCYVVVEECIGCKICARECPWDVIEMVPYDPAPAGSKTREAS